MSERLERGREFPDTPEGVTGFWRTKLSTDGARVGVDLAVPECDWTAEEIQRPMVDIGGNQIAGIMVTVLPEMTLPLLGRMYPELVHDTVTDGTPITDVHETPGWVKVYACVDAPNSDTTQQQLEEFARRVGYLGQRLRTYILASQAVHDLTGEYLDHYKGYARLLGSRFGDFRGRIIYVAFRANGHLIASEHMEPEDHFPHLGGRFEEVKLPII